MLDNIPLSFLVPCLTSYLPPTKRQETQRLLAEPVPGISATPYSDNLRYFSVAIEGEVLFRRVRVRS